jgi:sec-independent protein translocase protein TatC
MAFLAGSAVMLVAAVAVGFFVLLPMSLQLLATIGSKALTPMITARDYFGFAFLLLILVAAVSQLPVGLVGLVHLGIIRPDQLRRQRKAFLVASFVLGAVVTPGDFALASIGLALPFYALFEASIVVASAVHRRREKRASAPD